MSAWFDTFFDALAHDVWEALVPEDASDVEAAWLADRLARAGDDARRFLVGIAAALPPGAPFVVDAATVAESLLPHLDLGEDAVDRHASGRAVLTNRHRYDVRTSTLVTLMTLEHGGERAEREARHRVMTCREVVDALATAGFVVERIDGDTEGHEFVPGSPRCLITAKFRGYAGARVTA